MIPLATWLERRVACIDAALGHPPEQDPPATMPEPRDDLTDLTARIREDVRAELQDRFDRERLAERNALLAEFERARNSEIAAKGDELGRLLRTAIETMTSELSRDIAAALSPLLSRSRIAAAHEEFIAKIVGVLGQSPATALTVCGPEPLLKALREACGGLTASIAYVPSESVDARATFDDTVIETCIEDWLKQSGLA